MKKAFLVLSALLSSTAYAINFDISVGAIRHDPSGKVEYEGDRIDVDQDLRLGKKTKAYARLRFEHFVPLLPNLYLQYMPVKFTGNNRINRQIKYGDRTFEANADIYSSFKLDHYDVGLYSNIGIINRATAGVIDPELGLNVRVIDFNGKIRGTEVNTRRQVEESKSATVPIPMIYGALGINLPKVPVSFRAEVRALPVSEVKYYDLIGEVRVKPIRPIYVSAGYHYEKLKIDKVSDIFADLKVKGLFFMVGAEF